MDHFAQNGKLEAEKYFPSLSLSMFYL